MYNLSKYPTFKRIPCNGCFGLFTKTKLGLAFGAHFQHGFPLKCSLFRDCQQITFVALSGFCPLSKTPPLPPIRFKMDNQNQMKNTCPFYIVFQNLKVCLIKICKIQPPDLLFSVFISFYLHQQISFFTNF